MQLQLALDVLPLSDALELTEAAISSIDIVEIGTPLLLDEGLKAVRTFRVRFPEKPILADAKITDAGAYEAAQCFAAGANYVTVLGISDVATIAESVAAAKKAGGTIVADMICVDDLCRRAAELREVGITAFAVHTGVDQQNAGQTPLVDLRKMRGCLDEDCTLFVAGGITLETIDSYKAAGADVIICGGAIAKAKDPAKMAAELSRKAHAPRVLSSATLREIVRELQLYGEMVDKEEIQALTEACLRANRIFVAGAGRSGFAARGFANRLLHLDFPVYFVGETTTPPIREGDLLIVCSGSGETASLVANAQKAKDAGAEIATLTMSSRATIPSLADVLVLVPGSSLKSAESSAISVQPMGTLFEQLSGLIFDTVVLELMGRLDETGDTMFPRHANLE